MSSSSSHLLIYNVDIHSPAIRSGIEKDLSSFQRTNISTVIPPSSRVRLPRSPLHHPTGCVISHMAKTFEHPHPQPADCKSPTQYHPLDRRCCNPHRPQHRCQQIRLQSHCRREHAVGKYIMVRRIFPRLETQYLRRRQKRCEPHRPPSRRSRGRRISDLYHK